MSEHTIDMLVGKVKAQSKEIAERAAIAAGKK